MSTTLSIREIYDAALEAGFSHQQAATWTAIALAESGGRTRAVNDRGEHSVGLWQINIDPEVRGNSWGDLSDPGINAKAAFEVSRHGRDMRPWTTTHDTNKGTARDYRTYLDEVEATVGVKGDWRGVHGYRSPLLAPLADSQYDKIDAGAPLTGCPGDTPDDPVGGGAGRLRHRGCSRRRCRPAPAGPAQSDTDARRADRRVRAVGGHRPDHDRQRRRRTVRRVRGDGPPTPTRCWPTPTTTRPPTSRDRAGRRRGHGAGVGVRRR